MEYPGRGPLDGNRESLTTCAIDSSSSTALATAGLPSNVRLHSYITDKKLNDQSLILRGVLF